MSDFVKSKIAEISKEIEELTLKRTFLEKQLLAGSLSLDYVAVVSMKDQMEEIDKKIRASKRRLSGWQEKVA